MAELEHRCVGPGHAGANGANTGDKANGPGPRGRIIGGDPMPMGRGMNGGGMMGGGTMGDGMMGGGMCSMMMGGPDTKIEVKKIDKGVTITLTSPDAATTTRLQKMAEAMRLMHE